MPHIELCNITDGASKFHPCGATTDHNKIERRVPTLFLLLALCQFECKQNSPPNLNRILYRLQARCQWCPVIPAKIRMGSPGGQYQVVIINPRARTEREPAFSHINALNLVHQDLGISLVAQDGTDRLRDICGRENRQCNLVEKRLKCVVITTVDDGYVHWEASETFGSMQSCKTAANDHNIRLSARRFVRKRFRQLTQWRRPRSLDAHVYPEVAQTAEWLLSISLVKLLNVC